ncbi:hypothetical protein Tsubulata_028526 [Turnera subulata]|uniref:Uncharacterized protein n=1 Tax=Turnera subulata TaxID=218843 RepID=A0A9Q0J7F1_9ROSI|nr:hypothetical protein Tsubulata_028526 [Turnera subulata]
MSSKEPPNSPQATRVIRTKPTRCSSRVLVSLQPPPPPPQVEPCSNSIPITATDLPQDSLTNNHEANTSDDDRSKVNCDDDHGQQQYAYHNALDFMNFGCNDEFNSTEDARVVGSDSDKDHVPIGDQETSLLSIDDIVFNDWTANADPLEDNATLDLDSLAFLLDSEEWPLQ